jgi:hypothetical protein
MIQEQYNRIFNIANHVHRECFIYSNINAVWTSFIGKDKRLTQSEFNKLKQVVSDIYTLLFEIEYKINLLKYMVNSKDENTNNFIQEQSDIFESYLLKSNILTNQIQDLINQFKYKTTFEFVNIQEAENVEKGTRWIHTFFNLCNKYLVFPHKVCPKEYIEALKENWKHLEDEDTIIISDILDNILGGISIENISCNLRDWLMKYGDSKYLNILTLA